MVEIVNLRQMRKAKLRQAKAAEAAENRARHGRTAAEREAECLAAAALRRALDGAKTDLPD